MRRLTPCLLAVLALAAGACGDDEASSDGEAPAQTQTQAQTAAPTTTGCQSAEEPEPKDVSDIEKRNVELERGSEYTAVVATSCGTLEIRLAADRSPDTVASFIGLVRQDFYDGLAFHRIVPDFVVQAGDPEGTGEGGPGYEVVEAPPEDLKYERGVVAMAKTELDDPGTSGSQFFVVVADDAGLPPDYALLGRVSKGDDVLRKLADVPADPADGRPAEPVLIEDITIRES
jgi:peptidyl-prolyl cis-trans isomerase B (cyclophilin B)